MEKCRNNVGAWNTKRIAHPGAEGLRVLCRQGPGDDTRRDLWRDAVGREEQRQLHNIQNLINLGKQVLVYFAPEKHFANLLLNGTLTNCFNVVTLPSSQMHSSKFDAKCLLT